MNNRQKAKHWKMLYEQMLGKIPTPYIKERQQLVHYKGQKRIRSQELELAADQYLVDKMVKDSLFKDLMPILRDHVIIRKDIYSDAYVYSVDVFLKANCDPFEQSVITFARKIVEEYEKDKGADQ